VLLAFFILAVLWVLAWVVLVVLGVVKLLFPDNERDLPGERPAG
jgi:hypothetical protein